MIKTFIGGHMATDRSPYHVALCKLGEAIQTANEGELEVSVKADGVLGDEKAMLEQLQMGKIAAMVGTATAIAPYCPQVSICDFPTLFSDRIHFYRAADQVLTAIFARELKKQGICLLGILDGGWRDLYNSQRPLLLPDDLKGLKMRTMDNEVQQDTYRALGAEPMVISTHDSYEALKTRQVDGGDRAPSNFMEYGYNKVSGYYSKVGLSVVAAYLLVSENWLWRLDRKVAEAIFTAVPAITGLERKLYTKGDQDCLAQIESDPGVQVVEADREQFRRALQPVWQKHLKEVGGKTVLRQVLNV